MRIHRQIRCNAIVQPGEYIISTWDGERCDITEPWQLTQCETCEKYFCLQFHWGKHHCEKGESRQLSGDGQNPLPSAENSNSIHESDTGDGCQESL